MFAFFPFCVIINKRNKIMFGYISCDENYLSIDDRNIIASFYCGLCFSLKNNFGNKARLFTNIDCTYAFMLAVSACDTEIDLQKKRCMLHPFSKKDVAFVDDELSKKIASATILISYYKLLDDCKDEKKSLTKKTMRGYYKKVALRAKEILPDFDKQLEILSNKTQEIESKNENKIFELMNISGEILKQMAVSCGVEILGDLFYHMGQLVYFLDALDDYESDIKKKRFNALKLHLGDFGTKKQLLLQKSQDINEMFETIYNDLNTTYRQLQPEDSNPIFDNLFSVGIKSCFRKALSNKND